MKEVERRWRLILGKLANRALNSGDLNQTDLQMQSALDFLYSRNYEKRGYQLQPGGRSGGAGLYNPDVLNWLKTLPRLFPEDVCETIRKDAIERFELSEVLQDPEALKQVEPSQQVLESLLMLKGKMSKEVLEQLRVIIRKVVEEITERLRREVESAFSGRRNRNRRSMIKNTRNFDWQKTIRANLKNYDPGRKKLVINQLYFNSRLKRNLPWDIVLCVDQSGSMASSVIYSSVLASILSGLPAVNLRLLVFDTKVVDLSAYAQDPVELLMTIQLGGGTDIGKALSYCESLIVNPHRTIVALISDFYEGANERMLLSTVKRLIESRVKMLGLAALDDKGGPDFDRQLATKLAGLGMHVGAMTPQRFAGWLAEVMEN